jgi:hypothetical protein
MKRAPIHIDTAYRHNIFVWKRCQPGDVTGLSYTLITLGRFFNYPR